MRWTVGKFLGATSGLTILVCGLGYVPTVRMAGVGAGPAVIAGGLAALAASWVGSLPVLLARQLDGNEASRILGSTALRSVSALLLGLALGLAGWFSLGPLLVWLALSYVVLLPVDVMFAIDRLRTLRPQAQQATRASGISS